MACQLSYGPYFTGYLYVEIKGVCVLFESHSDIVVTVKIILNCEKSKNWVDWDCYLALSLQ